MLTVSKIWKGVRLNCFVGSMTGKKKNPGNLNAALKSSSDIIDRKKKYPKNIFLNYFYIL